MWWGGGAGFNTLVGTSSDGVDMSLGWILEMWNDSILGGEMPELLWQVVGMGNIEPLR